VSFGRLRSTPRLIELGGPSATVMSGGNPDSGSTIGSDGAADVSGGRPLRVRRGRQWPELCTSSSGGTASGTTVKPSATSMSASGGMAVKRHHLRHGDRSTVTTAAA